MPEISFIVLTYNSQAYIGKLLKSLEAHFSENINRKKMEIIVIDNNSSDQTVRLVKRFEFAKIIENEENLGFSKGINLGVSGSLADYLVVINPDTEFKSGNIFEVIKKFEENKKLGVIGGKIVDKEGKPEKSCGRFLKTFEIFLMTLGLDEVFGVRSSPPEFAEVDFVSGGFMIIRRKIFEELKGLDENLFMYAEDMEFCFRVKKIGYKVAFDPQVVISHHGHGSSSRSFAIENIYKGLFYFHKKHGTKMSYFMVKIMLGLKAHVLVLIGKIINNRYLTDTYIKALKI